MSTCVVDGCDNPAIIRGACKTHYSRLQKTGSYGLKPPADSHNARRMLWKLVKQRFPEGTGWGGFDDFNKSVGPRPARNYILVKVDEGCVIGPANFQWKLRSEVFARKSKFDWNTKAGRSAAKKALHNPDVRFASGLKAYGVTIDEYKRKLVEQNGVCAICENPETTTINGKMINLSVDHDHETGEVRGLLCTKCNRGLGMFCDDLGYLESATTYLRRYKKADNVVQLKIVEK
jgi:hypothetical protein